MLNEWRGPTISVRTLTTYEISDELSRRQLQVLERRYGGRLRAHTAATRIQRAFRQSRLLQQWKRLVVPIQSSALCSGCNGNQGCSDAYRHDLNSLSNVAKSQQTYPYLPCSTPNRPRISLSRTALLAAEQNAEIPLLATGENVGNLRYDGNSLQHSTVECMSPRLAQRRIVTDVSHPTTHVWLPRSLIISSRSSHSNSLPRLDKHETPVSTASNNAHGVPDQRRRRQYRIALNFFNKKPERGIQLLIEWGFVEDNSLAVANLLLHRRGLSKQMIGEYVGHLHNSFQSSVLNNFVGQIDLHGMEVDVALRHTLSFFRLPGEAQKIERIMQVFSTHYAICNPDKVALFHSADTIFILAFAIVMLNTDLHSPNIKPSRKMKLEDFINNLRGIDAGYDIDKALLVRIYYRIRESAFRTGSDHVTQVLKVDQSIVGKDKPKLVEPHRRLVCYCRLNQVIDRTKRQAANAHQREVFLFNDLLLIAKMTSKRKNCCQYVLRTWMTLLGVRVSLFESPFYEHGITITLADGQEIYLNSKNNDDRLRFVADVRESVAECAEMEAVRIETELDKHSLISRSDGQRERDSGLSEFEGNTTSSVTNVSPRTPQQALCSIRRLSFNSFDSGVVEEGCESFSHKIASPLTTTPFYHPTKHLEAAI